VGALGIFLIAGLIVAATGTALFVALASHVRSGSTQALDDSVIRWMGTHHTGELDAVMLEVTALGTGTVVLMIVAVAALFLILTQHKYSAILLIASTLGGLVLNGVLKFGFNRSRPSLFVPTVHAVSSSLPSGHAMSAAIVYTTVAYNVIAGVVIGVAWAGFCMATLEAIQKFGLRRDPRILQDEKPAPPETRPMRAGS